MSNTSENIQTTLLVLQTLIPVAASVSAMIGGTNVPITQGILVAQALLPVVEKFILEIGSNKVVVDVDEATDMNAVIAALKKEEEAGWPKLKFIKSQ